MRGDRHRPRGMYVGPIPKRLTSNEHFPDVPSRQPCGRLSNFFLFGWRWPAFAQLVSCHCSGTEPNRATLRCSTSTRMAPPSTSTRTARGIRATLWSSSRWGGRSAFLSLLRDPVPPQPGGLSPAASRPTPLPDEIRNREHAHSLGRHDLAVRSPTSRSLPPSPPPGGHLSLGAHEHPPSSGRRCTSSSSSCWPGRWPD